MAGHSKWAQIKRQKGVADQRRGAVFAKLANAITVAARNGTDPEMNFQLRIAIDKAKAANMPKDNIERAIERVKGSGGAALEEVIFEAYGPSGTAFLIETATDNRNRTVGEIRATLNKYGGKLAESGSVQYLFNKVGRIVFESDRSENLELAAIDAGASDIEHVGTDVIVLTDPKDLETVRQNLLKFGFESNEISFDWQPKVRIQVADSTTVKIVINLLSALDELSDVVKISCNYDVKDD